MLRHIPFPRLILLLPLVLTGCQNAIVGRWELVEARPNRETFAIDDAVFRKDGSFQATMTIEGLTNQASGTYDFIGYQLKLRPSTGGQQTFSAFLKPGRLELKEGRRIAILEKIGK